MNESAVVPFSGQYLCLVFRCEANMDKYMTGAAFSLGESEILDKTNKRDLM